MIQVCQEGVVPAVCQCVLSKIALAQDHLLLSLILHFVIFATNPAILGLWIHQVVFAELLFRGTGVAVSR